MKTSNVFDRLKEQLKTAVNKLPIFKYAGSILIICLVILLLYIININNYLLFHSIGELFSIVVAFGIFVIAWHLRNRITNNYIIFVGYAYLFIAVLDVLHTLSFKGMGVFVNLNESNIATQLWISARFLESIVLLLAPFTIRRVFRSGLYITFFFIYTITIIGSVFYWNIFPKSFDEAAGLTLFKIICEYVISSILILSLITFWFKRGHFEKKIFRLISWAIIFTILSELVFTAYIVVDDFMNFIGHLFKITSFFLIYLSIISIGLKRPFDLIFRELYNKNIECVEEIDFINAVLDNADALVVVLDTGGRILLFNKLCKTLTGYSSNEIKSIPFWEIFIKPDELDEVKGVFKDLKAGNFPNRHENYWIMKDGTARYISWSNTALLDSRNNVKYIISLGIDLTETRELEQENKNILNMIAHDLKSPLITIQLLASQILKKRNKIKKDEMNKYLSYINNEGARLNDIIDEFVEYSLMQHGVLKLDDKIIKPCNILCDIYDIYSIKAREKGIRINLNCELDKEVNGDEKRLKRVFTNLFDNAIKFTEENGSIKVNVDENGKNLIIKFSDNGCGITKDNLPFIFKPYLQGTEFNGSSGYGIGLSYVKSVIDNLSGSIDVKSNPGMGTEFTIQLPLFKNEISTN